MTLIVDTFNGAAPDRTWTALTPGGTTVTTAGGRGSINAGFATAVHRPDGDTGSSAMFAEIDLPTAFADGDRTAGVMTRVGTGGTATGYLASVNDQSDRVEITLVVNNEFSPLTGFVFPPGLVVPPTRLRLESEGTTHRLYLGSWATEAEKPAPVATVTDATITTGSRAALTAYNGGSDLPVDNFRAGSLADLAGGSSGGTPPVVGTSPARVGPNTTSPKATAAFNAAADTVLIACPVVDSTGGSNPTITMSNNGAALTWVPINRRGSEETGDGARPGTVAAYYAIVPAGGRTGLTVSMANSITGRSTTFKLYLLTGVDLTDVIGAIREGSSPVGNNVLTTDALVTESANSLVFVVANESELGPGNPTSSNSTADPYSSSGNHSGLSGYRASGAAGESVQFTVDAAGTSTAISWNWIAFEVRAGVTRGPVPLAATMITASGASANVARSRGLAVAASSASGAAVVLGRILPMATVGSAADSAAAALGRIRPLLAAASAADHATAHLVAARPLAASIGTAAGFTAAVLVVGDGAFIVALPTATAMAAAPRIARPLAVTLGSASSMAAALSVPGTGDGVLEVELHAATAMSAALVVARALAAVLPAASDAAAQFAIPAAPPPPIDPLPPRAAGWRPRARRPAQIPTVIYSAT